MINGDKTSLNDVQKKLLKSGLWLCVGTSSMIVSPLFNAYFFQNNFVVMSYAVGSSIFFAIGVYCVIRSWETMNEKRFLSPSPATSMAAKFFIAILLGILNASVWMLIPVKFFHHAEVIGKTSYYYYKGKFYHEAGDDCQAVWYGGDKENYKVTFVYPDKKMVYINGVLNTVLQN